MLAPGCSVVMHRPLSITDSQRDLQHRRPHVPIEPDPVGQPTPRDGLSTAAPAPPAAAAIAIEFRFRAASTSAPGNAGSTTGFSITAATTSKPTAVPTAISSATLTQLQHRLSGLGRRLPSTDTQPVCCGSWRRWRSRRALRQWRRNHWTRTFASEPTVGRMECQVGVEHVFFLQLHESNRSELQFSSLMAFVHAVFMMPFFISHDERISIFFLEPTKKNN